MLTNLLLTSILFNILSLVFLLALAINKKMIPPLVSKVIVYSEVSTVTLASAKVLSIIWS